MKELWVTRLRNAGIPELVIVRLYERYGEIPDVVVDALVNDDHRSGVGWLSAESNDPEVRLHDCFHLLEAMNYPIERFPYEAQGRVAFEGFMSGKSLLWILGASVGGAAIMTWRYLPW